MNGKKHDGTGLENFHESAPFPTNPAERLQQIEQAPSAPAPAPAPAPDDESP
jgi:hypothetical protein